MIQENGLQERFQFFMRKTCTQKIKRRRSLNLVINLLGLRNSHSISCNTTTFISFVN